jgi:hypothetical protein
MCTEDSICIAPAYLAWDGIQMNLKVGDWTMLYHYEIDLTAGDNSCSSVTAQAVSCRPLTAKDWFQFQDSHCGICGG